VNSDWRLAWLWLEKGHKELTEAIALSQSLMFFKGNCKTSWKCLHASAQFLKNTDLESAFPAKPEVLQLARL